MTLEMDIAAEMRTEAARNLIDQAQGGLVDLVILTALELCALGGPAHPLFDEILARAWTRLGRRQRKQVIDQVTGELVRRGLLIDTTPRTSSGQPIQTCALKPELGLMLAARCRPAFVVVVQAEDHDRRTLRFYALGDEAEPVRGFVLEVPAGLPPEREREFPKTGKPGPLGWFYRYVLVSRDAAAEILAQWTVSPPVRPGAAAPLGWLVSAWYPDQTNPAGYRLRIRGDGAKACLDGPGHGALAPYDVEGLRAVMLDLLTGPPR